jgi:hypothetical protein
VRADRCATWTDTDAEIALEVRTRLAQLKRTAMLGRYATFPTTSASVLPANPAMTAPMDLSAIPTRDTARLPAKIILQLAGMPIPSAVILSDIAWPRTARVMLTARTLLSAI